MSRRCLTDVSQMSRRSNNLTPKINFDAASSAAGTFLKAMIKHTAFSLASLHWMNSFLRPSSSAETPPSQSPTFKSKDP